MITGDRQKDLAELLRQYRWESGRSRVWARSGHPDRAKRCRAAAARRWAQAMEMVA